MVGPISTCPAIPLLICTTQSVREALRADWRAGRIAYNEDGREQAGMGVAAADFDHDGLLDIFKTNLRTTPTLCTEISAEIILTTPRLLPDWRSTPNISDGAQRF